MKGSLVQSPAFPGGHVFGVRVHDPELIFAYICQYKAEHDGNSPTLREIMDGCQVSSTSVVVYILDRLENAGRLTRNGGKIEITGGKWEYTGG